MKKISEKERTILQVLKKTNQKEYSKKIAEAAGMSSQTAVKYLMSLEGKGLVTKDDSQRPHIFWQLVKEA